MKKGVIAFFVLLYIISSSGVFIFTPIDASLLCQSDLNKIGDYYLKLQWMKQYGEPNLLVLLSFSSHYIVHCYHHLAQSISEELECESLKKAERGELSP